MKNFYTKLLIDATERGINLLNKEIDCVLLRAWQDYTVSVLDLICKKHDMKYNIQYIDYSINIANLKPCKQTRIVRGHAGRNESCKDW